MFSENVTRPTNFMPRLLHNIVTGFSRTDAVREDTSSAGSSDQIQHKETIKKTWASKAKLGQAHKTMARLMQNKLKLQAK